MNTEFIVPTAEERERIQSFYGAETLPEQLDWNVLIPLIIHIEYMGHITHIVKNDVMIKFRNTISSPSVASIMHGNRGTKMQAVYKAILAFIEWVEAGKPEPVGR